MRGLNGRVAIVTGAGKGLGRGIALRLAEEGVRQVICARTYDDVAKVAGEIEARGGSALPLACDVTKAEEIADLVRSAAEVSGTIDILVNNAAFMSQPRPLQDYDDEYWASGIEGGLTSAYRLMQAVFPHMKDNGGRIVNMTSLGGLRGVKGSGAYGAAKTGLIGLTRAAANDWGAHGITVNCVAPMGLSDAWQSFVDTQPEGTNPFDAIGVRRNALNFAGDPERDIAPAVAFLCSEDSRYITGAVLPVDGGLLDLE